MKIGRVYKIITAQSNEVYIGSTFNKLKHRFHCHKNDYRRWKSEGARWCSSYELFEKYGIENCKMMLIKEYEVIDRNHLSVYETLWIKKLKSINEVEPSGGLLKKQYQKKYREENKDKIKKYYEENKEKIKEHSKKYYEENKDKSKKYREENQDKIKDYQKKYRQENKDKSKKYREENQDKNKDYKKKYREENKDKLKEKILCNTCNCEIRRDGFKNHLKTQKHLKNINQLQFAAA